MWLLVGAALAGCLGSSDEDGPANGASVDLPPLCDGARPGIVHQNGVEVASDAAPIYPCFSRTGVNSREPTIGISSQGTLFHYPAMTGNNAAPTGVAVSRDHGASWEIVLPTVGGVLPTHVVSTDPYFFLDPATDRIFADDLNVPNCSMFSWSDDEGATWDHSYSGCMETDHQTIFTGPPVSSAPIGYPNIVYRCAMNAVALGGASTMSTCQASIDGGRTWLPPREPAFVSEPERAPDVCSGATGHGASDAQGRIYLPKGHCGEPWLAISADEGATWTRVRVAETGTVSHETGVGADPAGNVYYLWIGEDELPYIAVSRDGGATWGEPLLAAAPGVTSAELPELIVGGNGKLAFVYMGTTGGGTWNAYLGASWNALDASALFTTVSVNDPDLDPFIVGDNCCGGVQDFLDVRIGPDGTAYGAFIDDCLGEGTECAPETDPVLRTAREGVMAWLVGAPTLWDEEDANGVYP